MKTEMKKCFGFILPFLLLCGCDFLKADGAADRSRAQTRIPRRAGTGPQAADTTAAPQEEPEILWISGVEYPSWYDWRKDSEYGSVDARLILFRDGERVLEIPVGDKYENSTDPDMHRIVGGHLYTEYSSSGETVIQRDGQELFRFAGREVTIGFLVRGETVWTLGVSRSGGKGIVLRRDGKPVFSDPKGMPPPGFGNTSFPGGMLHLDGGDLFFYYHDRGRWFQVREQHAEPLDLPWNLTGIHDIRHLGGKTVIAGRTDSHALVIAQDGSVRPCTLSKGNAVRNVSVVPVPDDLFCLKGSQLQGSAVFPTLWNAYGGETALSRDPVLDFFIEPGHSAYVASGADGIPTYYSVDGNRTPIKGRNHFMSSRCALLRDRVFHLLLTPMDHGRRPFLLRDGIREEIPIDGFLSGMDLSR